MARLSTVLCSLAAVALSGAVVVVAMRASVHRPPYAAAKAPEETFRSGLFDPPRDAPDFALQGSTGKTVRLRDYRGKIVVLEFGFTFCQHVCPVTLGNLRQVFAKLGPAASDVQVVFVTVDPKRDSPERLAQFLGALHPSFVGVTGTAEELRIVRDAYGIMAEEAVSKNAELGYEVNHSSFIYLVDRAGRLRVLIPFGKPVDDIVADLRSLLQT
jgi:protein SCO1/2